MPRADLCGFSLVTFNEQLEYALGTAPTYLERLSGGMIGTVHKVVLADGTELVAKRSENSLKTEAMMLRYLSEKSDLPVPEIVFADDDLLMLEYIEGSSRFNLSAEHHAAELLAELHKVKAQQYGFEEDTLIGSLPQPNSQTGDWSAFFWDNRLSYMAELAREVGRLPPAFLPRLERLGSDLDKLLGEPGPPSLIHGDVWSANVLASGGRITAFLDPALYYAEREVELAYIALFGTFGETFFARYHEIYPIREGFFELRRYVYSLYPLLTHVRYFGGHYVASVDETLEKLGY